MKKREKKKDKHLIIIIFVIILIILCFAPFFIVGITSIYQPKTGISLEAYYDVFLASPRYLLRFWRSLEICFCIAIGQIVVSGLAGFGFAKYKFPGKNILFFFLMILMILPLQVTLVPNYIMLNQLRLLGTNKALIYPSIFMPLGTFILIQSFKSISNDIIDGAKLDGCNTLQILLQIVLPMNRGSFVCVGLLSFLDAWNMVEQPIAYLKNFSQYPLSVALAYVSSSNSTRQFVCCILVALPPLCLFSLFSKEMVEGIIFGEEK
jgi:multiple sugar transport system permease protein